MTSDRITQGQLLQCRGCGERISVARGRDGMVACCPCEEPVPVDRIDEDYDIDPLIPAKWTVGESDGDSR